MSLRNWLFGLSLSFAILISNPLFSQSINSGTVRGTVLDPSQMVVPQTYAEIVNPVTGYTETVMPDDAGQFRFNNVPPNMYEIRLTAPGFATKSEPLEVQSSVPISLAFTLQMAEVSTSVDVNASLALFDTDPSAHTDADSSAFMKLPRFDPASGLSGIINNSTGGTAADANGFFHPLGDHGQVSFVIDGQPISDQQNKLMSTQLPVTAIQSIEATTGTPAAEFGDKSSLVAQITTRSGLASGRVFGNIDAQYGSFGTTGGSIGLGFGNAKFGNFIALDGVRSGRFLDTPEFTAFHDKGNNETIFDRFDYQPSGRDAFHLNLFAARNWFQIANDYDQLAQDQHQRVLTWSIAPGYQHTFSSHTLLTINPYIRKDQVNYYASRDPFADTPATQSQNRQLLNWGAKVDVSTTKGRHNLKYGLDVKQTRLLENFGFGVTDPGFNSP